MSYVNGTLFSLVRMYTNFLLMKTKLFIAVFAVLALSSCAKKESQVGAGSHVDSFTEIKTPAGFNFSSTQTIIFKVPAIPNMPPKAMSLVTIENAKGITLLKYNVDLAIGLEMPLTITAGTKELFLVRADGSKQALEISGNELTLNSI